MATIFEALQNAHHNLQQTNRSNIGIMLAKNQLRNAVILLEKGYYLYDDVDMILEEFDDVSKVPNNREESHDDE
jgi:hypothetical protein